MSEYQIYSAPDPDLLVQFVESGLKGGWIVQGGVSVSNGQFYQAMTKEDKTGWIDLATKVAEELK